MCPVEKLVFCAVLSILVFGSSAAAPKANLIKPCSGKDCLKNSLQSALPRFIDGMPELGIGSLDPFTIRNLTLILPGDLKVLYLQGTSRGLKKCVIDSARMIGDTLDMQVHCNFTIKGKYKSTGQLLMFAINGEGNSIIRCKNINIHFLVKLGATAGADGKRHLEVRDIKTRHSFDGEVYYRMDNLIKGNPAISAVIVEFMNRNWRLVAEEFGGPIVDFGVTTVLKNVKKLLSLVPLDQLVTY